MSSDALRSERMPSLTERERDVLLLRAEGQSLAAIARHLAVEPRTVKFHLRNIYAKLGNHGSSQVARQRALAEHAHRLTLASDTEETLVDTSAHALFRPDRKLTDVLRHNRFTLSAEVMPPRNGAEQAAVLAQVERLVRAGAHFLAVTKGAGGSLRGGSLPIAQAIKERFGVPAIAHFTCRDLVPAEVENHLIDHHYFGIRNILALRGDPPDGQPEWQARDGGYSYAYELIEQIHRLNQGHYLPRTAGPPADGQAPTDFCIGAAAYPEHPDAAEGLCFFQRKVEAGAQFAITQMVFDADAYGRFLDRCERAGLDLPILPGTRILRSRLQTTRTAKFGVTVPPAVRAALPPTLRNPDDADATARGVDAFLRLVERLRSLGAPGIHVFVTHTPSACRALSSLTPAGK